MEMRINNVMCGKCMHDSMLFIYTRTWTVFVHVGKWNFTALQDLLYLRDFFFSSLECRLRNNFECFSSVQDYSRRGGQGKPCFSHWGLQIQTSFGSWSFGCCCRSAPLVQQHFLPFIPSRIINAKMLAVVPTRKAKNNWQSRAMRKSSSLVHPMKPAMKVKAKKRPCRIFRMNHTPHRTSSLIPTGLAMLFSSRELFCCFLFDEPLLVTRTSSLITRFTLFRRTLQPGRYPDQCWERRQS